MASTPPSTTAKTAPKRGLWAALTAFVHHPLRSTVRAGRRAAKAFDRSAEWMAEKTRPKTVRPSAKMEWDSGERLMPAPVPAFEWTGAYVAPEDRDLYRALMSGQWVEFGAWPNDEGDWVELERLARARCDYLFGPVSESWVMHDVQLIVRGSDRAPVEDVEDAEGITEDATA